MLLFIMEKNTRYCIKKKDSRYIKVFKRKGCIIMKQYFQDNAISINSVELDNLIWLLGKNNKDRKSIAHHTITIYY